jgi:DNA polymerase-3 subunit delta'
MHEKPNSISVDDVRQQIVNDVLVKPYSGKYKIYIVPDAEKMTAAAQNALLKTIEEPPAYAVILLLANNASALLPTILSRCVMLSLKPVADDKVKQYLMEHVQVPDYEADVCVAFAQGNIGKAVQLATSDSFNEIKNSALHLLKNVSKMEINDIIATVKSVSEFKIDIQDYLDFLAVWYRDILYFKATRDSNGLIFKDELNVITDQINKSSYEGIENILRGLQTAKTRLNANVNFDLTMELLFLLIKENLV